MRADHAAAQDLAVAVRLRRIVKQQSGDHQFDERDACLEPQLWRNEIRISFFPLLFPSLRFEDGGLELH